MVVGSQEVLQHETGRELMLREPLATLPMGELWK